MENGNSETEGEVVMVSTTSLSCAYVCVYVYTLLPVYMQAKVKRVLVEGIIRWMLSNQRVAEGYVLRPLSKDINGSTRSL